MTSIGSLSRGRGDAGAASTLATVADAETAAGSLAVTVSSPAPDILISNLVNTGGTVTATVRAAGTAALV